MTVLLPFVFCVTQLISTFAFAQTVQTQDLFERRRALEQQIRNERYAQRTAEEQQALFRGFRRIAGRASIDYSTSTCSAAWNALQVGQPVAKICDAYGCLPVWGLASEGFEGYISWCGINLTNGWQCKASSLYDNSVAVYSATCLDPKLNQHDYIINRTTGAVRNASGKSLPRR